MQQAVTDDAVYTSSGAGLANLSNAEKATLREKMRRTAAARPFIAYMAVVTALTLFYFFVIATPRYVSETRFSIRSKDIAAPTGFLTGILGTPSGLSDIVSVSDYIKSQDMLNELQKRYDLRAQYSQPRIDPFEQMRRNAPDETFKAFYNRHVVVKLDREANTVIVDVKAFTPQAAKQTADAVLDLTEQFVNGMSQRMRDDSLRSAQQQYDKSLKEAQDARAAVTNFRGENSDLDPGATGAYLVSSLGTLQAAAVTAQSQLASLKTYSRPDAPAVLQLEAQLANINAQIAATKARQSAGSNKPQQVTSFETLQMNRGNAERTLGSAQAALDVARASAEQREKFVERIVLPNTPQKSTDPNKLLETATALVFALAGYALVALTAAAIRDHRGV